MSGRSTTWLAIREFDRVAIGDRWESTVPAVSNREVALLDQLQKRSCAQFFEIGHRTIRATQWVGSVGLGGKTIDVLPKIDVPGVDEMTGARANLLHMLSRSGLVSLSPADMAAMLATGKPLIAAFMEVFLRRLASQWRSGPIRQYVAQSENRAYMKGRLNVIENERLNRVHRQRFFTTSDEFTANNAVSQVLKAALAVCLGQRIDMQVLRLAESLWMDFDEVDAVGTPTTWWRHVTVDRTSARFGPVLSLAKLILERQSPDRDQAGRTCFTLMFDMNEVFERFVAAEMRAAVRGTGAAVRAQVSGKSLLLRNGKQQFQLRPDLGIFRHERLQTVLDTKWKRLTLDEARNGVSQSDMYQMYAYGKEYGVARTVLVYPRHGALPSVVATYEHPPGTFSTESQKRIEVTTVDVSAPLSKRESVDRLRADLRTLALGPVGSDTESMRTVHR